jgi:hypothetical protein
MNVHMFWAYGQVSQLERLAMRSFVGMGYDLTVWTYNPELELPEGVMRGDASEILEERFVFKNRVGSYAGFSDLFRYAVLNTIGGMYADTDVIALRPVTELPPGKLLVRERKMKDHKFIAGIKIVLGLADRIAWFEAINGNIIVNPKPEPGGLIDIALERAHAYPKEAILWPEIGPALLTQLVQEMPGHGFRICDVAFANPIAYWRCPDHLVTPGMNLPEEAFFLHCYNEMWRWRRIDKNDPFPTNSIMDRMQRRYS